jgi:hypothetical protein
MINIQAKIHDRFSVEFKVGFNTIKGHVINKFMMNTWIFVPYSLDINAATYSKEMFYRDLRSNTRLITPVYLLKDIVKGKAEPFNLLKKSFEKLAENPGKITLGDYEYNIKMFAAIFKSSLRNQIFFIMSPPIRTNRTELCEELISDIEDILRKYRDLHKIITIPTLSGECFDYYLFGDEFMSNIVHKQLFRVINFLKKEDKQVFESVKEKILNLITKEIAHRKSRGYPVIEKESKNQNRDLVYRSGALKKYVESELFLNTNKKRDAVVVEQVYYSVAAGISMIFATAVAFSFQLRFGNFTIPFFVALVVSYMLKDRIKELARYYFAHKLKEKYFDNKTTITLNDHTIGWSREGFDFIKESVVPSNILRIRDRTPLLEAQNRYSGEKIILFRKLIELNREELEKNSEYPITGVNEIMRFNLSSYMQKMDDPDVPLYVIEKDGTYREVTGDKVYFLNFVIQFKFEEHESYKRYRIVFNRNGIEEIEELL